MQVNLRILPTIFLFFRTGTVFFLPFLKYRVEFRNQSEGYIGEENISDMIEVILLFDFTV